MKAIKSLSPIAVIALIAVVICSSAALAIVLSNQATKTNQAVSQPMNVEFIAYDSVGYGNPAFENLPTSGVVVVGTTYSTMVKMNTNTQVTNAQIILTIDGVSAASDVTVKVGDIPSSPYAGWTVTSFTVADGKATAVIWTGIANTEIDYKMPITVCYNVAGSYSVSVQAGSV